MKFLSIALCLIAQIAVGQISGTIKGKEANEEIPLPGASVFWEGTDIGTTTDSNGKYSLERSAKSNKLKVSFIGYTSETKIVISRKGTMNFSLEQDGQKLNEVELIGKVEASTVDLKSQDLTYKIDSKELRKAACCNLSESFETNASVDVSFADAVTGTKHIEMLGLAGRYALVQRENIPFARGINASTGFTYIPGPFVESIQLTKGLSSVMNGYESITGQINVELLKPENAPKLFLNLFGNQGGRMEGNIASALKLNSKTSTEVMAHYSNSPFVNDNNSDGFADMPIGSEINLTNKWHFGRDGKGWEGQINAMAIQDIKKGGQINFVEEQNPADSVWGYSSTGRRFEVFGKAGYIFDDNLNRSVGLIFSANFHDRVAQFGERNYFGEQYGFYFNSIFQDIIGHTNHRFKTGLSLQADDISEVYLSSPISSIAYISARTEIVPGAYFEYTYNPNPRLTMVAGIRGDYNSFFEQAFLSPRANVKYSINENSTLRIGGGRGQRTANPIIEHIHAMATGRFLNFDGISNITPEVAWNSGLGWTQKFSILEKEFELNLDGFYTYFENQLVVDSDFDPSTIYFLYRSQSRSLSLFSQLDFELIKNLEMRLAYKFLNSEENYLEGLRQVYLVPKNRAFANLSYSTESKWKFDFTLNWFGEKRLPDTDQHPTNIQIPDVSPSFFTANVQMNKEFKNGLEVFFGSDNVFNYTQSNSPIINSQNPYSNTFDTNYAWGPIFGRNVYLGIYYSIK